MGIDDLVNKGKEFLEQNKDKIEEVLHSDKAEEVSDSVLDAGAEFVKKVAPESVHDKVEGVRDNLDKSIGNDRWLAGAGRSSARHQPPFNAQPAPYVQSLRHHLSGVGPIHPRRDPLHRRHCTRQLPCAREQDRGGGVSSPIAPAAGGFHPCWAPR